MTVSGTGPMRVEALVDTMAARCPDHPALVFGERRWSYADLWAEMHRRAAALVDAGLRPGDVVLSFLACCRAGLVSLHLSPNLTPAELAPLIARSEAKRMLRSVLSPHPAVPDVAVLPLALPGGLTGRAPLLPALPDAAAAACIRPTSGTTGGGAKLVVASHQAITWRNAVLAWDEAFGGVYYFPQTTFFPVVDTCTVFAVGGTIVVSHATEPTRIELEMASYGVASLWTVPAIIRLLAGQSQPCPPSLALRVVRTGAAPLPPDVEEAVVARYGARVVQKYASTEGGSLIGTPEGGTPAGSIGIPYTGVEARLVDIAGRDVPAGATGELVVRSPGLMRGYLGDPEATARALRDGWLWTGDLARRDADGFYYLEGRRALRINVGGFKVAPEEVEAVLEHHPSVKEVVVVGAADGGRGEVVRAVIVPEDPPPSVGELRRYCRDRLAGYKIPRRWEFREELPRSPLGKVLRHLL